MASKKNKSNSFLNAIKAQSEEQRKIAQENISTTRKETMEKADSKHQAEAQKYINKKLSIAEAEIKSEYAVKSLNAQGELFKLREEMVSKIFDKAREKLLLFSNTDDYKNLLCKLATEIYQSFGINQCVIYLKADDMKYCDDIKKILNNATIKQDDSIIIGGVKGYCKELSIVADNTLDSKLSEQKTSFTEKAVLKIF